MQIKNALSYAVSILCLVFVLFAGLSCSEKEEAYDPNKESIFDQFIRDSLVQLTIETDFQQLFENKQAGEYQPAVLVSVRPDGSEWKKDIQVSARGVTRKKICAFPPLKFAFSKEELLSNDLLDFHTLKLVTHCSDTLSDEQLLLKEYLVYKLYNLVTDHSFHVQLARVQYVDTGNKHPSREKNAFLIENNKEMAARLQGELLDEDEYQLKTIDRENYNTLVLFQYMIGNTDWNLSRFHNVKLVLPRGAEVPVAVPYDFDYCGLVNAPYAVPYASLPIKNVRERFLQWRGKDIQELAGAIQLFLEKKPAILAACHDFTVLDETIRADIVQYLESFFVQLEEPERLELALRK